MKGRKLKLVYVQIDADPQDIRRRSKDAYAVLFEEVMRRRKVNLVDNSQKDKARN